MKKYIFLTEQEMRDLSVENYLSRGFDSEEFDWYGFGKLVEKAVFTTYAEETGKCITESGVDVSDKFYSKD